MNETTKVAHTASPLVVRHDDRAMESTIYGIPHSPCVKGEWALAVCSYDGVPDLQAEMEANAVLYAAAPDLLRLACKVEEIAMAELSGLPENHEAAKAFVALRDQARSAIARATGADADA